MQRTAAKAEEAIRSLSSARAAARHLNAFTNYASEDSLLNSLKQRNAEGGVLSGALVAVKDNICTFDLPTTCASNILRRYMSPHDATVVRHIREAGGLIVGKTNMDEFGMGSHSLNSAFGPVETFSQTSAGGSSGGSAVAVATGQCDVALGTDTGGSVRLPAAYNGILGFKPSYGMISRWGVIDYANSLDTVGIFGKDSQRTKQLFETINIHDSKDPTSLGLATRQRLTELLDSHHRAQTLRIGVPTDFNISEISPVVRKTWSRTLKALQKRGHTLKEISLPAAKQALPAYYVLAPAEASSNLAKYDNVRYGSVDDAEETSSSALYTTVRQKGFGSEVRRRILLGAYTLSAEAIDNYFVQAQKIRRLVQRDLNSAFALPNVLSAETQADHSSGVDVLLCPTAATLPPTLQLVQKQTPLDSYAGDIFTVTASLAGIPAVSVPIRIAKDDGDEDGHQSVGMQVMTQFGDDLKALEVAELLESLEI